MTSLWVSSSRYYSSSIPASRVTNCRVQLKSSGSPYQKSWKDHLNQWRMRTSKGTAKRCNFLSPKGVSLKNRVSTRSTDSISVFTTSSFWKSHLHYQKLLNKSLPSWRNLSRSPLTRTHKHWPLRWIKTSNSQGMGHNLRRRDPSYKIFMATSTISFSLIQLQTRQTARIKLRTLTRLATMHKTSIKGSTRCNRWTSSSSSSSCSFWWARTCWHSSTRLLSCNSPKTLSSTHSSSI